MALLGALRQLTQSHTDTLNRAHIALQALRTIRLPAYYVNGVVSDAFDAKIASIDEKSMTVEAENQRFAVDYYFIPPSFAIDSIIADASTRNISTLLIHEQFLLDGMSDSQLEFVMRDGAYKYTCPIEERKVVKEIYSWVQIGPYCQYSGMEF